MAAKLKKLLFDSEKTSYFLMLPALLFAGAFTFYPLLYNFYLSVHKVDITTLLLDNRPFVGLENYTHVIFSSGDFLEIFGNTLVFVVSNVFFQLLIGFAFAYFFIQKFYFHKQMRGLVLIGWVMPPVIVGTIWRWLLNGDVGFINYALSFIGISRIPWLASTTYAMIGVIMANVWLNIPFNMILITSALVNIPADVKEASAIDGANSFQRLRYIVLPLIKPTLMALAILNIIFSFRGFALIWSMTMGGPVNATTILPVWSYVETFNHYNFGRGTALANIILVLLTIFSLIYIKFFVYKEEGETL